jgi:hypothetical protein
MRALRHLIPMDLPSDMSKWDPRSHPSPFRLRFELGGVTFGIDQPVPRFIQAFGRAKQLAAEVFEPSRRVFGVVATWSEPHASSQSRLADLRDAGFTADPVHEWQAPLWPDEPKEDQIPARWMTFDLTDNVAARDVLIWCSVASEMRIGPRAAVIPYLADFVRGIILYVYDDRGMDIISFEPAPLLELYAARNEWLLDYDRPRMRQVFE